MRLGADQVSIVYRRTREEMPAADLEIEEAQEEGLVLHTLVNPTAILGNGHVEQLELIRQQLGEFDDSARRRPSPIEGSEFTLQVDVVIAAIGQSSEVDCVGDCGVVFNRNTTAQVGRDLATTREGVFAAGDLVLGPATVVEAVAQGNQVAETVDAYLREGEVGAAAALKAYDDLPVSWDLEAYGDAKRAKMPVQDAVIRRTNWQEVELGFSEAVCREECKRCLRCDLE
jgi:NADPH-dependent glutamate synthase beta subunit-like oxidoreductase